MEFGRDAMPDHFAARTSGPVTLCAVVLFAVLAEIHASVSLAQSVEDKNKLAKELFENGIQMFDAHNYTVAAESFRAAYKARPSWKILYNIGQAESAAGRYGLALEAFQEYLVQGKDEVPADRKDFVINEIRRLRDLVGDVEVKAPEGSVIYVDGVERGTLPLLGPILVEAGAEHEAVVVAPDGKWTRKFMVWGGKSMTLRFEDNNKQQLTAAAPAISPPAPRVVTPIPAPAPEEGPGMGSTSPKGGLDPLYVWIGLGATGAFGICALGFELGIEAKMSDYKKHPSQSLKDEGEALQPAGITFMALTGAALVTTGILAIFTDWESLNGKADANVSVAPFATDRNGGVVMSGRF